MQMKHAFVTWGRDDIGGTSGALLAPLPREALAKP